MKKLVEVLLFGSLVIGQALAQSQWKTTEKTNAMDNVTVRTASLESDAAAGEKATLIIRNTGSKAEVYVATEEVLDEDPVRIKFDDSKPEVQFWGRSTDYHALFASNPQKLIERLKGSKKFYIEYHPFQRVATAAVFVLPQAQTAVSTPNMEEVKTNSEDAKSSPAAAASLAQEGHVLTPQELADAVKAGRASKCAIVTSPPGAKIFIDGNKMGVSPVVFVLMKRDTPRTITVKMAGYKTVEKQLDPDGKTIPLGLTLEKE